LADLRLGEAAAPQGSGQQLRAWEDSAVVSTQKEREFHGISSKKWRVHSEFTIFRRN